MNTADKFGRCVAILACAVCYALFVRGKADSFDQLFARYSRAKRSSMLWEGAFKASDDGDIVLENMRISYADGVARKVLGLGKAQDLSGRDIHEFADCFKLLKIEGTNEEIGAYGFIQECLEGKEDRAGNAVCKNRFVYASKDNRIYNVSVNWFYPESHIKVFIIRIADITTIQQLERTRASEKAKTILISSLSHELRTPLNGVISVLKDCVSSEEHANLETLQVAFISAQFLRNYISNVLDYAEFTNGKLTLKPTKFNLRRALRKVSLLYQRQIDTQGVKFVSKVDPSLPKLAVLDRRRFKQILTNLLGLSLRYTFHGTISLSVSANRGEMLINLLDTGTGLPYLPNSSTFSGLSLLGADPTFCDSGIHLAVTKVLVEAMHGHMEVSTKTRVGNSVRVTIPMEESEAVSPRRRNKSVVLDPNSLSSIINPTVSKTRRNSLTKPTPQELSVQTQQSAREDSEKHLVQLNSPRQLKSADWISSTQQVAEEPMAGRMPQWPDVSFSWMRGNVIDLEKVKNSSSAEPTKKIGNCSRASSFPDLPFRSGESPSSSENRCPEESAREDSGSAMEGTEYVLDASVSERKCGCKSVLLVDDCEFNLFVAARLIRKFGLTCDKVCGDDFKL